jgi:hypothetical protein
MAQEEKTCLLGQLHRPLSRVDLSIRSSKEGRIFAGVAIGRPLPQHQIVQADKQYSPLQEKTFHWTNGVI